MTRALSALLVESALTTITHHSAAWSLKIRALFNLTCQPGEMALFLPAGGLLYFIVCAVRVYFSLPVAVEEFIIILFTFVNT